MQIRAIFIGQLLNDPIGYPIEGRYAADSPDNGHNNYQGLWCFTVAQEKEALPEHHKSQSRHKHQGKNATKTDAQPGGDTAGFLF